MHRSNKCSEVHQQVIPLDNNDNNSDSTGEEGDSSMSQIQGMLLLSNAAEMKTRSFAGLLKHQQQQQQNKLFYQQQPIAPTTFKGGKQIVSGSSSDEQDEDDLEGDIDMINSILILSSPKPTEQGTFSRIMLESGLPSPSTLQSQQYSSRKRRLTRSNMAENLPNVKEARKWNTVATTTTTTDSTAVGDFVIGHESSSFLNPAISSLTGDLIPNKPFADQAQEASTSCSSPNGSALLLGQASVKKQVQRREPSVGAWDVLLYRNVFHFFVFTFSDPTLTAAYQHCKVYIDPNIGYAGNGVYYQAIPRNEEKALILNCDVTNAAGEPVVQCDECFRYFNQKLNYFKAKGSHHCKGKLFLIKSNTNMSVNQHGSFESKIRLMCSTKHHNTDYYVITITLTDHPSKQVVAQKKVFAKVKQWKKHNPNDQRSNVIMIP